MSTSAATATAVSPLLPGSLESYLVTDVPHCGPTDRVDAIRAGLVGATFESVDEVVVSTGTPSGRHLEGLIPLERLLAAQGELTASDIMDADPPVVTSSVSEEQAAWKAVRHGESSLAVVDADGAFVGLVPPTRLLGALLLDHDDDFARLGGYLSSTASARLACEEPLHRRLWHRIPWLLVGLVGAGLSAWLVGGFEETIAADIRLAFFMPGVVYLADAVGTQTEALIIRGLAVGVPLRGPFVLEALTGLAMGPAAGRRDVPGGVGVLRLGVLGRDRGDLADGGLLDGHRRGDAAAVGDVPVRRRPGVRQRTAGHRRPGPVVAGRVLPRRQPVARLTNGPRAPLRWDTEPMNQQQFAKMQSAPGFIAALDQSGGSTPKALRLYGVDGWADEAEMFDRVHEMRARIMTSPSFDGARILGTILFEQTMDRDVEGRPTPNYLWDVKGIVSILKVDKGLADEADGAKLMKPMPELDALLTRASEKGVFGTKMRSFVAAPGAGLDAVVNQQFEIGRRIVAAGLVPILEPEVDIKAPAKAEAEAQLHDALLSGLDALGDGEMVMLKLTLPEVDDLYLDLVRHPRVLRVFALSGGYTRAEANERLARQHGVVASFSRALTEGLSIHQTPEEFDVALDASIASIFAASIT